MNDPKRIDDLEQRVRKLEQQTEPIRITDTILLQTLVTMAGQHATDIGVLKETTATKAQIDELRQDIQKRFGAIAETMNRILERLPEK